jgi:hypothetical protein
MESVAGEQHRGRREERTPLGVNVCHVIRADQYKVIHASEHERARHRDRDDPAAKTRREPRQRKTGERAGQNDDVDEEIRGKRQRNVRSVMGCAVRDRHGQMSQDGGRQPAPRAEAMAVHIW